MFSVVVVVSVVVTLVVSVDIVCSVETVVVSAGGSSLTEDGGQLGADHDDDVSVNGFGVVLSTAWKFLRTSLSRCDTPVLVNCRITYNNILFSFFQISIDWSKNRCSTHARFPFKSRCFVYDPQLIWQ